MRCRRGFVLALLMTLSACNASPVDVPALVSPTVEVAAPPPPMANVAEGERLFEAKGCTTCHSIDGTPKVGPTMKDYFGSTVQTNKGARVVDAAFVSESILDPQAVVTTGSLPVMPSYAGQLKPIQLESIAMYLMQLSLPSPSTKSVAP